MLRYILALTVVSSCVCTVILPAHSEASEISLNELIKHALTNNGALVAERYLLMSSEDELQSSKWLRYPSLRVEGNQFSNQNDSRTIYFEQPIWLGGSVGAQIELSEADVKEREARLGEAKFLLVKDISENYFEALRYASRLNLAQENRRLLSEYLNIIERRVASGISPAFDLTLAQARLNQAARQLVELQEEYSKKILELERLSHLEGIIPILVDPTHAIKKDDLSQLELIAVRNSPAIQRSEAEKQKASKEIELERASFYPQLVGGVSTTSEDLGGSFSSLTYYLSLRYDSGRGLSNLSRVRAATNRLRSIDADLDYQKKRVKSDARLLLSRYQSLREQLESSSKLKLGTAQVLESYLRQFKVNKKSWLDVLNAHRENYEALSFEADNFYGFRSAIHQIEILLTWPNYRDPNADAN